jgi:WAP-type (Whey Acidic Protein) ''four-disulfide core''.
VDADGKAECPPAESASGCLLDKDCPGTQKCCTDGCTLVCTAVKEPPAPEVLKGEPGDPGDPGVTVSNVSRYMGGLDI